MRINAYLAKTGLSSRRKAEQFILDGRVTINGHKAVLSDKVSDSDKVALDGNIISAKKNLYFLVYKPIGYVSTVEDEHAEYKVVDLIDEKGLFPVGRLDKDSEGLMILTNDGDFAQKLIHPRYEHERQYVVDVKLPFSSRSEKLENALKFFKCGIRLDDKRTQPCQIKLIGQHGAIATFEITMHEGMKRQIRRTFEKAGLTVMNLKRVRMLNYQLGDLEPGEFREFTPDQTMLS